ncbi:phosphate/phosphite/phosphonate ABC transporter substrate-binding protein, partial [bacterium]|nr:phosphate/phosphite/phosphonate ABC transporter substrate-binding protein [bacterium]
APPLGAEDTLTVAVARTPGGPAEWSNWTIIIKHLSDEIGQPLSVRYLSKEDEAAEVISSQDIDIAFVCAHHYVDLAEDGVCVGVCTPIISGSSTTRSLLVARSDDVAASVGDLKGATIAVSDKSSLGGYAYLSYLTKKDGMTPEEFCGELRLGDTQEQNVRDVLEGTVRATVVNTAQVAGLDMSRVKVLEESEPVGCPPVVVASDMAPELRERIRDILLSCDVESLLPTSSVVDGFKPLDSSEYEFAYELRDACGHHVH